MNNNSSLENTFSFIEDAISFVKSAEHKLKHALAVQKPKQVEPNQAAKMAKHSEYPRIFEYREESLEALLAEGLANEGYNNPSQKESSTKISF